MIRTPARAIPAEVPTPVTGSVPPLPTLPEEGAALKLALPENTPASTAIAGVVTAAVWTDAGAKLPNPVSSGRPGVAGSVTFADGIPMCRAFIVPVAKYVPSDFVPLVGTALSKSIVGTGRPVSPIAPNTLDR